jgi:hypothetical protein
MADPGPEGTPERPPAERQRVGPWLRSYGRPPKASWRERLVTGAIGLGAVVLFGAALVGILMAFVRWPVWTLAGLIAVWLVGMAILALKRQRDRVRRELERRGLGRTPGDGP